MTPKSNGSQKSDLWLAICWISGMLLCILVIEWMSGDNGRLRNTSNEFLKWVAQVMLPITLLVLTRVFGKSVRAQFDSNFDRKTVYWVAMVLSVVFIAFTLNTIYSASKKCNEASSTREATNAQQVTSGELCEYHQTKPLSEIGTTILIVLIWPILSMLLDYLFPNSDPTPGDPTTIPRV